ncbi:uncharacterized protein UTRI_03436_B [Ustilago trichophora]|uniref:BTB domain-containing protein n=1 Tax=Ustilago trichophora TaxID=86804 RepID=A0A5C3E0I3_9BASI|nr:uncharacterized protein UTRI_03436_B [Ustilago trichophora]
MTSLSSRFSSLSSANAKAYHPPKPTYNSPKLVQDVHQPPSTSSDHTKPNHPFATSSYGARRRAPTEPEPYREPASISPRNIPHTSEFGSFRNGREHAPLEHTASLPPCDLDLDPLGRKRSSTLGSQHHVAASNFAPLDDFLPSPNPFKSQFDDSEDEEKLDNTSKTLSGVPHRARLAALGTASRLFKGRRHSRNSSGAMTPNSSVQDLPPPLQVDKRSSKYRDAPPPSRPTTSDGSVPSPNPRQAVFGHRPSPSELSILSSRSEKTRSVAPADRDLILGLTGTAFKPSRPKTADTKKLLSRQSDQHRQSSGVAASFEVGKPQWMAPPPYCAADEADLSRRESLRKSQSLSTLQFDPSRRPRQPSPVSEVNDKTTSMYISNKTHADQTAWEAMLTESPSTVSDHSSISSCGRVTRTDVISDSPPRRLPKPQRLPPQKPPPQFGLPPPPPLASRFSSDQHLSDSTKSCLEVGVPCASLAPSNTSVQAVVQAPESAPLSAATTTAEASLAQLATKPASPKGPRQQLSCPSSGYSKQAPPHSQVVLDVGGTKFVTLISTLRGKAGDQPRLIDTLEHSHKSDTELVLCNDIHLTRSKRVDVPQRAIHERSDSDQSSQASHFTTVDETVPAEQIASKQHTDLGLGLGLSMALEPSVSQSSTSLSTTASASLSHTESDTSTRRTSDVSDSSNWSKAEGESELATSSDGPQRPHPNPNIWDQTALPSSRLCSPHFPPFPSPTTHPEPPSVITTSIFLDRNADLYRDILDILRTSKLPYRLQAASMLSCFPKPNVNAKCSDGNGDACSLTALRLQLRCRLHEVQDESDWLGYPSIVKLCQTELCLV